jgi:hypothetical protein
MEHEKQSRLVTALMGGGIVVLGAVLAASLALLSPAEGEDDTHAGEAPAHVEPIAGTDLSRVTLTAKAIERVDLRTTTVQREKVKRQQRLVIPYAALLYDANGATWTYTSPEARVFERAPVTVDFIKGDRVVLTEGPSAGTKVVTVGAQELLGAEFGVGH